MATFFEGRRGSGKSKYAVEFIQNRLKAGHSVATNLDIFLDKLIPDNPKAHYVRLPDFPRSIDLLCLGKAYPELDHDKPETYDEKKNGGVILDELLTSFNSRNWNDPDRLAVVNWIVQSRKDGWDLKLIGQSIDAVDKQIKETVIDELYSFRSSLNLFPGIFWKTFVKPWFDKLCPKFHIVKMYDGRRIDKNLRTGSGHFRRNDLHDCYKTSQQFKKDVQIVIDPNTKKAKEIDLRASYSVLHPHYFGVPSEYKKAQQEQGATVKPEVTKSTIKKDFPVLQLVMLCFAVVGYFFVSSWSDSKINLEKENIVKSETVNKDNQVTVSEYINVKTSDLGQIFINGLEFVTDGRFTYFFNDEEGNVIHPQNVGYKVLFKSECHAKLTRDNEVYNVYCNPKGFNWSDEPPVKEARYQEETTT
ncbi:zonular occludens toxin domain-containing protein [Colwellia sp. E2M01]|uniref:zonular occludens toxin domain-containing protein n=1 Tax=Colwellia sp. E2M01 TaxID=2841561 RepID=UPI001C0965CE|nr:zonular occludens toxin domain-containing protein [Colwellia sp. E2M01]MBU2871533.1 hypothetical protein [Colwellia sp. E2M01]